MQVRRDCPPVGISCDDGGDNVRDRLAGKRLAARQHFIQHTTERENIAALIGGVSPRLLGRHVAGRAENDARIGSERTKCRRIRVRRRRRLFHSLGQAEIENFDLSFRSDLDVGRLQIAMNDAFFVCSFQCISNLMSNPESFFRRNRPTLDPLRQRVTLDKLHYKEMRAVGLLHSIERRDVGMIQRREQLRFAFEPRDPFRIPGESIG